MTEQLDAFLKGGTPDDAAPPTPAPAEAPQAANTPPPEAKALPESKAATEAPEPEEEALQHVQGGDNRTVPFSALEKVRNDWKSKYAAEQAKSELLAKQLEEAKKPPPQPQAQPQQQYIPQPPDPGVDPRGWAQHMAVAQQQAELNRNLNTSEWLARDKLGDETVNTAVAEFRAASEKDPALWGKLYSQAMPYQWLVKEMDRQRAHADIGDDPAAYRARVIAEERAKWEQEMQTPQQPVNGDRNGRASAVAGLPPSLANARSVAGRTQTAFTGPPPLSDLFPDRSRGAQRR